MSRFACIASAVMTAPSSGSGPSSGLKWLISFALPDLATLSWRDHDARDVGDGGEQVHLLVPAGLGALALLAVHGDAAGGRERARDPRITAGSSQGCSGCGRNQPSSLSSRKHSAAGGFRFFRFFSCLVALCFRAARGVRGRDRGSSAASASAPVSAASNPSAIQSSPGAGTASDADGATRSPVTG